jgi:putative endonuclease
MSFSVYILANAWRTIYVGMTDDLPNRIRQHRRGETAFTKKYNITKLVWFETATDRKAAASREKQIKGWKRFKKIRLITEMNPEWKDLAAYGFAGLFMLGQDPSLRSG